MQGTHTPASVRGCSKKALLRSTEHAKDTGWRPCLLLVALLLLLPLLGTGCSWTSGLLGFGDESPENGQAAEKSGEKVGEESGADAEGSTKYEPIGKREKQAEAAQEDEGLVPRPERSRTQVQTGDAPEQGEQEKDKQPQKPVTGKAEDEQSRKEPQEVRKPERQEEGAQAVASVKSPRPEESRPPVKAKGAVPIDPSVKSRLEKKPAAGKQDMVYYKTTKELHEAIQEAINNEKFLGYTDPFDAFPVLEGVDTMSAAFIPVGHPEHKIFYHAFFQPTQPFHKRVYGYTVIDMTTNQDYGYFDGNADGVFEQETLDPKIVLDDYIRASKEEAPEASGNAAE